MGGTRDISLVSGRYGEMPDFVAGVLFTVFAAAAATVGNLLMKHSQTREDEKEARGEPSRRIGSIPVCSLYWWGGFFCLALLPTPCEILALAAAAQSIIYPVGAGLTIVFVQLSAPFTIGEKLTRLDWLSTILVVVGCVVTIAFGSQEEKSYSVDELLDLFDNWMFQAWFVSIWVVSIIVMVAWKFFHLQMVERIPAITVCLLGFVCSTWAATQGIVLKATAELIEGAFGDPNANVTEVNGTLTETHEFSRYEAWIFVVCVPIVGIFQLVYMNYGLESFKAVKFIPVYNTMLVVFAAVTGALYYEELEGIHPVFFPIGLLIVCCGIGLLIFKDTTDETHLELEHAQHRASMQVGPEKDLESGLQKRTSSATSVSAGGSEPKQASDPQLSPEEEDTVSVNMNSDQTEGESSSKTPQTQELDE